MSKIDCSFRFPKPENHSLFTYSLCVGRCHRCGSGRGRSGCSVGNDGNGIERIVFSNRRILIPFSFRTLA